MTGILPTTSGNYGFKKWQRNPVLKAVKTLPEYFRENGYEAYYTGKVEHQPKNSSWTGIGLKQYHGPTAYNGKEPVPLFQARGSAGPLILAHLHQSEVHCKTGKLFLSGV